MNKQSKEMAKLAYQALSEKKAEDIRIIDISEISVIADYFIIASGSNANQLQAMQDSVMNSYIKPVIMQNRLKEISVPAGF